MTQPRLSIEDSTGRLAFTLRNDNTRPWWRDLDLDGELLYRIGNICDTCEALFEKHREAQLPLTPAELADQFRAGLGQVSQPVVDTLAAILPAGDYVFGLFELRPALVQFASPEHYLWENSQPVKVPQDWLPDVERMQPWWFAEPSHSPGMQEDSLYEAVLPLIAQERLDPQRIEMYHSLIQYGSRPTALALSVVDLRIVSGRAFDWRLIHFLLDGHHKMMAASQSGSPITLLSCLNTSQSFAPKDWVERIVQVRYQSAGTS